MGNMRDRHSGVAYSYPRDFVAQGSSLGHQELPKPGLGELLVLVIVLAGVAIGLYLLGGIPHLPQQWPSWDTVVFTLRGSYLPPELMVYVVSTIGWLLWAWAVSSLVLESLAVTAEAVSSGAVWAGTLRQVSGWLAIPLVRRAVDGTLGAMLLAHVMSRPPLEASAAGLSTATVAFAAPRVHPGASSLAGPMVQDDRGAADEDGDQVLHYTVQLGDNLWDISKRFYGTGEEWPRLMTANVGRVMTDGRVFPREGVIQPGWVLRVPLPSQVVETAGAQTYYSVEAGDTLYGIAARLLGDENRWVDIFDVNRGVARLDDGRTLTQPELIWPGLRLRLPLAGEPEAAEPSQPAASGDLAAAPVASAAPETPAPLPTPAPATTVAPEKTRSTSGPTNGVGTQLAPAHDFGSLPLVAAAAATAAALGGAALVVRRRFHRDPDGPLGPEDGEEEAAIENGFVVADPARALTHRLHGQEAELALLAAEHLRVFLGQRGIGQVGLLSVCQGKRTLSLTLRAPLAVRAQLIDAMHAFRKLLGLRGDVHLTQDHDVRVEANWLKRAASMTPPDGPPRNPPWLVPLGRLGDRRTLYVNWREVSNLLVAGSATADVQTLITSLLTVLGARCQPPYLRMWVIADPNRLPPPLCGMPHLRGVIDPREEVRVQVLLDEVRQTLLGRMVDDEELGLYRDPVLMGPPEPELLVVVGELGELAAHQATLEFIGRKGPAYGVRLLGATAFPDALNDELVACFGTRVVLGLEDEGASLRLMGTPDGVDLDGGQILVRLEGREVLQARGFAIAPEQLEQVVGVMQEAYLHGRVVSGPAPAASAGVDQQETTPVTVGPETAATDTATIEAGRQRDAAVPLDASNLAASELHLLVPKDPEAIARHNAPEDRGGEQETCREVAPQSVGEESDYGDAAVAGGETGIATAELLPRGSASSQILTSTTAGQYREDRAETQVDVRPVVEVRCFGGLTVTCGGQELAPVGPDGAQFKAWEFLAVIATQPGQGVTKEHVVSVLWPGSDPHKAERRLPNVLARLRGVLGFQVPGLTGEFVQIDRAGIYRFNPTQVTSDVHQFLASCQEAARLPTQQARVRWEHAVALYQGDLLLGRSYEWVQDREDNGLTLMERYRAEYLRVLRDLAAAYLADGEVARAAPLYHRLLERDAADEEAVRGLYRCYHRLGDRTAILREHRQLKQALAALYAGDDEDDEDVGFEPEPQPETMAVYAEVMADLEAHAKRPNDERSRRSPGI